MHAHFTFLVILNRYKIAFSLKGYKTFISFVRLSVRLSEPISAAPTERISVNFDTGDICKNKYRNTKVG